MAENKPQSQQSSKAADSTQIDPGKAARQAVEADQSVNPGDARVPASATTVGADITVTEGASPKYSTQAGDVPDPRSGKAFETSGAGLKGQHGFEALSAVGPVVAGVDPKAIPAEVTPGVTPNAGGDRLLAAAQAKAPSLTREFVQAMGLPDEYLAQIARGEVPPPPTPGPIHTSDMYLTPGGFQQTPPGVKPEDVGANQIHRA